MSNISKIWIKIRRKWTKIRLRPIHVYCFHHVCQEFDSESMNECDWMQIDEFKRKMISMQQDGIEFISISIANKHICNDWIRCKKYAVVTFDDGYTSLKEILPWLEEKEIPVTLFINGKYLDGRSYRENPKEQYLTRDELFALTSPLIEIGSHGWEHKNARQMSEKEFMACIDKNIQVLANHPCYIPFHAYTWGAHTETLDRVLHTRKIIPVLMDGAMNYNDQIVIHRELFDK